MRASDQQPDDTAFHVRPATVTDAAAAAGVIRRSIEQLCIADHENDPRLLGDWLKNKTAAQLRQWIEESDSYKVVAERAGEVVGFGMLASDGTIRFLYVSPQITQRGIGAALLDAMERRAREWGLAKLRLESTRTARAFYARFGFVAAPTCAPARGQQLNCLPLEKIL